MIFGQGVIRRKRRPAAAPAFILSDDFAPDNAAGMSTPETGSAWTVSVGNPAVASGKFYSHDGALCVIAEDLGVGDNFRIRFSVGVAPAEGATNLPAVEFCLNESGLNGYQLVISGTAYALYRTADTTLLDSYATAPANGDDVQIDVIQDGNIVVSINGTARITSDDATARGQTVMAIFMQDDAGTTPSIGVHSGDGAFTVATL